MDIEVNQPIPVAPPPATITLTLTEEEFRTLTTVFQRLVRVDEAAHAGIWDFKHGLRGALTDKYALRYTPKYAERAARCRGYALYQGAGYTI